MSNKADNYSWVVVEVRSGIPVSARAFSEQKSAQEYSEKIRENLNLENDETGIFPIKLEEVKI